MMYNQSLLTVLPVYEPELNMNQSTNQVVEPGGSFEIQHTVVTGLGASVFWRFPEPLNNMNEGSGENDRYWLVSHSRQLEGYKIEHTKQVIVNNMSEILTGVYSLVVIDLGYPRHRVHKLFNVTVTMPRESSSSTAATHEPTSDPGTVIISTGIHCISPPFAVLRSIVIPISVCAAILILLIMTCSLMITLWCRTRYQFRKCKNVISAENNHQLVQFMEKGSLTKLQSLEFPRSRITKITRLGWSTIYFL